jgi:hypothetical protein
MRAAQVSVADSTTVTETPQTDVPHQADPAPVSAVSSAPSTVVAQAQKARRIAYISAGAIVFVFAAVAFTLHGKTESGKSVFHTEDQIAMIILGVACGIGILWFTRPRIVATTDGIRVRNLLGWIDVPWQVVASVRFDRGSPWVSLELQDDDLIAVMAIQAADKEYAVAAVRALRAMLAASRVATPVAAA